AKAKTRKYIAFHAAWAYFADRYGLEKVAVVQEFAGEEPTPKEVARLVRDARAEGVGTVLVEPQLNPRVAQTIGKEFGARTVMTDPLGDPGDAARDTYEELMQFNARAFGQALQRSLN
ncbi:MAG: metal ABC transporter substrate-binding protein, partial [Deltaproteobacteria bacterium]|nr:metal ABC transporter substrate-binding protein [Deltaproteobacteria bacterium]